MSVAAPTRRIARRKNILVATWKETDAPVIYTLVDPHGMPAWQGRADAGQSLNQTRTLKPVPGKWGLTLSMENATGRYDIAWKSE